MKLILALPATRVPNRGHIWSEA